MMNQFDMWGGAQNSRFIPWLMPFLLVDLLLRGFALWKSAQKEEKWWFIALIVVNSMGILPGIYLLTHQEPVKVSAKTSKKK